MKFFLREASVEPLVIQVVPINLDQAKAMKERGVKHIYASRPQAEAVKAKLQQKGQL